MSRIPLPQGAEVSTALKHMGSELNLLVNGHAPGPAARVWHELCCQRIPLVSTETHAAYFLMVITKCVGGGGGRGGRDYVLMVLVCTMQWVGA